MVDPSKNSNDDNQEVLGDEPRSILMSLISQLGRGTDLHRVTLPTFVLEPRSFLERITDFMSHIDILTNATEIEDPVLRFTEVVKYYLSGWHVKPKGVKKPYNPVLGEIFRCQWKLDDDSQAIFVSEQVSHHPPVSAFFFACPQHRIKINGDLCPKSKFLGNTVSTSFKGGSRIYLDKYYPDEVYEITYPNMYTRGILFGTMYLELGDFSTIRCPRLDLICEIEFKTKGYFYGTYNSLSAKIKTESTGESHYEISGKWSDQLYIRSAKSSSDSPKLLFDAINAMPATKIVPKEEEQEEWESRRLWSKVTAAIMNRDLDLATEEKTAIEESQRSQARDRQEESKNWHPQYFDSEEGHWSFRHQLSTDNSSDLFDQYRSIIFEKDNVERGNEISSTEPSQNQSV